MKSMVSYRCKGKHRITKCPSAVADGAWCFTHNRILLNKDVGVKAMRRKKVTAPTVYREMEVWDPVNREWVGERYMQKLRKLRKQNKEYYRKNAATEATLEVDNLESHQVHRNEFKPINILEYAETRSNYKEEEDDA